VFHLTWLLLLYTWFSLYCFHCIHGIVTFKPKVILPDDIVCSGHRREAAPWRERPRYPLNCVGFRQGIERGYRSENGLSVRMVTTRLNVWNAWFIPIWHWPKLVRSDCSTWRKLRSARLPPFAINHVFFCVHFALVSGRRRWFGRGMNGQFQCGICRLPDPISARNGTHWFPLTTANDRISNPNEISRMWLDGTCSIHPSIVFRCGDRRISASFLG
jgi:hypothetical protein